MVVTKKSLFTGQFRSWDLPITEMEYARVEGRFDTGELVQDIVPHLDTSEREFLITGTTPEEWVNLFGVDLMKNPVERA